MKMPALALLGAATLGLAGCSGWGSAFTPGSPGASRSVAGTVEFREPVSWPADAVLVVRVVDPAPRPAAPTAGAMGEPVPAAPTLALPPETLGEVTIRHPSGPPIPFRIDFAATDDQLRHGLTVEARLAWAGKVQYYNKNSYGLPPAQGTLQVWVDNGGR